ncbi:hypothetical protein NBZ79_13525 [Sneathiella marina]|uniref:Uncharacterized protein n=1 Tax=Sneathiella marina TaxID=2950108 RepID=A0ABY4W2S8_9PROT|nr:hypothetical protein [Sneathiella marina]USG60197.1 hypothetical protein NBZ79_13525 [Sneathiella marina]
MTTMQNYAEITRFFEAHELDNATFRHADHVRVAHDLLCKYDFTDAVAIYAKGIKTLAAKAGAPQKFNTTITYAFMSLIAERMATAGTSDFDSFVSENPDLMSKNALGNLYTSDRLQSDLARRIFLLPTTQGDAPVTANQKPSLGVQPA